VRGTVIAACEDGIITREGQDPALSGSL
jgi:hypothetical protein